MPTFDLTLDLHKRGAVPSVVVVRVGDLGTQTVVCHVTDDGSAYTVPSGYTAQLMVRTHAGTWARQSAKVSGSTLTAVVPDNALAVAGTCKAAYFRVLNGANTVASTDGFVLRVLPDIGSNGSEQAESYDDQLDAMLSTWEGLQRSIDASTKAAIAAKESATQAASNANEAAEKADASTSVATAAAKNADASAKAADGAASSATGAASAANDSASAATQAAEDATKAAEEARGSVSADKRIYFTYEMVDGTDYLTLVDTEEA